MSTLLGAVQLEGAHCPPLSYAAMLEKLYFTRDIVRKALRPKRLSVPQVPKPAPKRKAKPAPTGPQPIPTVGYQHVQQFKVVYSSSRKFYTVPMDQYQPLPAKPAPTAQPAQGTFPRPKPKPQPKACPKPKPAPQPKAARRAAGAGPR